MKRAHVEEEERTNGETSGWTLALMCPRTCVILPWLCEGGARPRVGAKVHGLSVGHWHAHTPAVTTPFRIFSRFFLADPHPKQDNVGGSLRSW